MKDESKLIFILSIRFSLVMMVLSFFIKLFFFTSLVSLLFTPLVVGIGWLLLSFILLKLVRSNSEEIFTLLIPRSSDNEMGDSNQIEEEVDFKKEIDSSEDYELKYDDLFDSSKNTDATSDTNLVEGEDFLLKEFEEKSGQISSDDFRENDAKDIAKAVSSMLKKD